MLVRRVAVGNEIDLVELESHQCGARRCNMSYVNRIEGAAEESDFHDVWVSFGSGILSNRSLSLSATGSAARISASFVASACLRCSTPSPVCEEIGNRGRSRSRHSVSNASRRLGFCIESSLDATTTIGFAASKGLN